MRDHSREKNILVLNIVYIGFCLPHSLVLCLHSLSRTDPSPLQPQAVLPIPGPHSPASGMGMGSGPYFPGLGASAWMRTGDLIRGFPWDSYILNQERFSLSFRLLCWHNASLDLSVAKIAPVQKKPVVGQNEANIQILGGVEKESRVGEEKGS